MFGPIRWLWVILAALGFGCVRQVAPAVEEDLSGLRAVLLPNAALKLSIAGQVGEVPAEVVLDVASPLTRVADACFPVRPPQVGTVWVPQATGDKAEVVVVRVGQLRVADRPLAIREVALEFESPQCVLALGSDVLLDYAIEVDPERRELSLSRSQPASSYLAQPSEVEEVLRLELHRDPRTDWPLIAIRLRQKEAELTGAFLLSTATAITQVSDAAAREAGFQSAADLLDGLTLPPGVTAPPLARTYALDGLELAPRFGLRFPVVRGATGAMNPSLVGTLGSDVWGRFHSVLDVRAGVWVLRRLKVSEKSGPVQCRGLEANSETQCFRLHVVRLPQGVLAVGSVWRDLPEGGRLYLEPLDEAGAPIPSDCRLGLAFARADRGISSQHLFPWEQLERSSPMCFQALAGMRGLAFSLFEEGGLKECPGHCAFMQHLPSGRLVCDCQPAPGGSGSEAELRFLQLYRHLLEQRQVPSAPERGEEPEDPLSQ